MKLCEGPNNVDYLSKKESLLSHIQFGTEEDASSFNWMVNDRMEVFIDFEICTYRVTLGTILVHSQIKLQNSYVVLLKNKFEEV